MACKIPPRAPVTDADKARIVIAKLYVAMSREGWEKGPTIGEARDAAQAWLYQTYGHDEGAASEVFWQDLGLEVPQMQEAE